MTTAIRLLLAAFVLIGIWYASQLFVAIRERRGDESSKPRAGDTALGFVAQFFDTLGIGSFATTTAMFKLSGRVSDEQIPGTLNVGYALSTVAQALIFVAAVTVDPITLFSMIAAAIVGAWVGGGVVSRLPRRAIQVGMGVALLLAATLFLATNLNLMPGGGDAVGLRGGALVLAIGGNFVLGALMMLGIGLYAPCLVLVSMLGMNPLAAFPIMMGSCALLMPIGSLRFIRSGRLNVRVALALTVGSIPAVLIAGLIVKSLPIVWLRWLIVFVVLHASVQMLLAAMRESNLEVA
ncbi:MAG TPA: TSUP family transporter [Steroidobacter sp.]|uniref:TSUP family transporter n=1 Tax=Steroidobacter sp. TaxID=1978227 RepID=UPI002ED84242